MESHIPVLNKNRVIAEEKEKLKRVIKAGLNNDYNKVFSTPEGVRVLNDILEMTHLFKISYSLDGSNQSDFREGERNIGLKLVKKMSSVNNATLFKAFKINLKQEYS